LRKVTKQGADDGKLNSFFGQKTKHENTGNGAKGSRLVGPKGEAEGELIRERGS